MTKKFETWNKDGPADSGKSVPAVTREAIAEDLSAGILFPDEIRTAINMLRKMR